MSRSWTAVLCRERARHHDARRWELDCELDALDIQIERLKADRDRLEAELNRRRSRAYSLFALAHKVPA